MEIKDKADKLVTMFVTLSNKPNTKDGLYNLKVQRDMATRCAVKAQELLVKKLEFISSQFSPTPRTLFLELEESKQILEDLKLRVKKYINSK